MNYKVFPSVLTGALVLLMLGSIVAGAAIFRPFEAQAQTVSPLSLDDDCGTSTSVDAAPGPNGETVIVYDCSSDNTGRVVRTSGDGSSVSVEPQTVADGCPCDMSVTSSSSGEALVLSNDGDGHIVAATCSSGGACTVSPQNPDNPTPPPPPEQTVTLASGVDTSPSTCDGSPCTIDNDNFYDSCNDGCDEPATVVTSPPETYGWDTIEDTQWISGSPNGTGFEGPEPTLETHLFFTTFSLPNTAQNPSLSLSILADGAAEVFLNGHSLGSTLEEGSEVDDSSNYQTPTGLSTSDASFFNIGDQNTLSFHVSNVLDPMGLDYNATITYDEIIVGALPNYNNNPIQSIGFNPFSNNAQITPVHVTPGGDSVSHPVGAFGSGETLYAAWEDRKVGNTDIMFGRSDDGGTTWSPPNNIAHNSAPSLNPRIAASGDSVFVTWEDGSSNKEILLSKSTDGGEHFNGGTDQNPAGDPSNLSSTPGASTDHEIALDGSNFYVVWADKSTGNGDIILKRSTNGGNSFLGNQKIEATNHATSEPDLEAKTFSGSKVLDIVWSDESGTSTKHKEAHFVQSTNGGTTFSKAIDVSNTKGESVKVLVSIPSASERYVAWLDSEPRFPAGSYKIFASMSTNGGVSFNKAQPYSEAKSLAAFVFDLADKVCAWDPHCSRCQGDTYGDEYGAYSYGTGAPLVGPGWLW